VRYFGDGNAAVKLAEPAVKVPFHNRGEHGVPSAAAGSMEGADGRAEL